MLIGRAPDIRSSEITDDRVYLQRRDFIRLAGGAALATAGASLAAWEATTRLTASAPAAQSPLQNVRPHVVSTDERLNSFEDITSYNNFYEFGHHPKDPQRYAGRMKTSPWTVRIDGLCNAQATMIPLAVTSTKGWIRRLGRRWQTLHRIVYLSAAAACLHFAWKVKVVVGEPVYCVAILTVLLGFRLLWRLRLPERPRPARI